MSTRNPSGNPYNALISLTAVASCGTAGKSDDEHLRAPKQAGKGLRTMELEMRRRRRSLRQVFLQLPVSCFHGRWDVIRGLTTGIPVLAVAAGRRPTHATQQLAPLHLQGWCAEDWRASFKVSSLHRPPLPLLSLSQSQGGSWKI